MGSFLRPSGGSAEFIKTQQRFNKSPVKNTIKNLKRKFSKNISENDPKNLKESSTKATKKDNQIESCSCSNEYGNISTEQSASSSGNENSLNIPKDEETSKHVEKALEMIQSTIAEASDLEKVIRMSGKLSSDGVYIRDVMLRLVIQLNKIETESNQEVIQKKNEAIQFLQEKMKQLVRYSEEAQRKMLREKRDSNQSYLKCDSDKYCKSEQVKGNENLSIITEDVEKELRSQALEVFKVKVNDDPKEHFKLYYNLPGYDQYVPKEEIHLCDNSVQVEETKSEESHSIAQMKASLPSCFVLLPDTGKAQTTLSSSSAMDADHSNSSFEIIQQPCSSSYILDDGKSNLTLKRLVGPYIVINHDISKSLVASRAASIHSRLAESGRYENRTMSKDEISITEETTSIQRNIHTVSITPVRSTHNINWLFGGRTLISRLLVIILIALLIQIPLLMITCTFCGVKR